MINKKKIKSYLKEITDETIHLYMVDSDKCARVAAEGYLRFRSRELNSSLKDTTELLSNLLFETVVGIGVRPRPINGEHRFEVTQFNIADALERVWKIRFNPKDVSIVVMRDGAIRRVPLHLFGVNDLVDRYVSNQEIRLAASGKWDLLYHKAELQLGSGFVADFRFFIAEDEDNEKSLKEKRTTIYQ